MKIELNAYCPCCGYDTFRTIARLEYSICPICYWEDDPVGFKEAKYKGGANSVSLIQDKTLKNLALVKKI
nr:CPCC family cysteine-rich protein [Rhodocytophaga rosea]